MIRNRGTRSGFTLIELVVVIAIIAILAAILLPVIHRVKTNSQVSACISNMRQLAGAIQMYRQDWDGSPPATLRTWRLNGKVRLAGVDTYVNHDSLFVCPLDKRPYHYRFHLHSIDPEFLSDHDRWACSLIEQEEPPGAVIKCFSHVKGRNEDRAQVLVLGATLSGAVNWVPFADPSLKDFMISELGRR